MTTTAAAATAAAVATAATAVDAAEVPSDSELRAQYPC